MCQAQPFRCGVSDDIAAGNISSFYPGTIWPKGEVAYEYHSSLTPQDRDEVHKAFLDIQAKTCIRFHSRAPEEAAYVSIALDPNPNGCGVAILCRSGGYQYAMFGGSCRNKNTMVHELSHSLCLSHEFNRWDRDDYLLYYGCPSSEIPPKNDYETRGHLFDYQSRMMSQCDNCGTGWPKNTGQPVGQCSLSDGLSVLDADKINDLYDCKGCFSHRWRPIDALTDEDRRNMVPFGRTEGGYPLYLCRGYTSGTVTAGKFWPEAGICYIPYGGGEVQVTTRAQVYTLPLGKKVTEDGAFYEALSINKTTLALDKESVLAVAVPVGRKPNTVRCFGAVTDI
ncbi:unnamed protein product [Orchesella dallaii]|uniref:Metalloendopeptidase n=1 Tax=Orchesella dallaii TaxID=48710 RepID=A0ABP1R8U5_9HEXA